MGGPSLKGMLADITLSVREQAAQCSIMSWKLHPSLYIGRGSIPILKPMDGHDYYLGLDILSPAHNQNNQLTDEDCRGLQSEQVYA